MIIKTNYIPHIFRNKYLKNLGGSYSSTVIGDIIGGTGSNVVVIDDLETSSKEKALSANMGRVLNEKKIGDGDTVSNLTIENLSATTFTSDSSTISALTSNSIVSSRINSNQVATDRVTSKDFQSGNKGYSIDAAGNAEFNTLNVRGTFNVNSINYNKITSTNGEVWITDSADIIMVDDAAKQVEVTSDVFQTNDVLLCQVFTGMNVKRCQIRIINTVVSTIESTTYFYENIENSDKLSVGDTLVRLTNDTNTDRQQYIKLSPYQGSKIDIIDDNDVNVRLGNLSGITDEKFGVLDGFGLYAKDAYLTGAFKSSTCSFNNDGSGNICNDMMSWDANGNFNFNASISADKISGGTISSDLIKVNEVVNEPYWALKKDGSGYLSNKKIEWDAAGNLTLQFGTKKQFVQYNIDDYDFNNSFFVDLSNGLNFVFTKNADNDPRTITIPCSQDFIGLEVEMIFDTNPGNIRVQCTNNYALMCNGTDVRYISVAHSPRRLKLVARKYHFSSKGLCSWWIDNMGEYKLSSDETFAYTF